MDATSVATVLRSGDLIAVSVAAIIAAVPVIKGLFAVRIGRHRRRREFIEFWRQTELYRNDLWLEEIVQHRYGAAPPARLIRYIASQSRPSYKLKKVAMAAGFFDLDGRRGRMAWVRAWREKPGWFGTEVIACWAGYLVLAPLGIGLLVASSEHQLQQAIVLAFCGTALTGIACAVFWHLITLMEAHSTIALVNGELRRGLLRALLTFGWARVATQRLRAWVRR